MNPYGQIYVTGGSTAQSLTTSFAKLTLFATAGQSSDLTGSQAVNSSVVPVVASDHITCKAGGVYLATATFSGSLSAAGDVTCELRKGSTALPGAVCVANFATSNAKNNMSLSGIFYLSQSGGDQNISVYAKASGSLDWTLIEAQLTIVRIS